MIDYVFAEVSVSFMRIVVPLAWAIGGILWNWEHVKEYFIDKYNKIKDKWLIITNGKDH